MVPQFRPQAALHMLEMLVTYKKLSPLLPSNKTLIDMDDAAFSTALDDWTEAARSEPYVCSAVAAATKQQKENRLRHDVGGEKEAAKEERRL